MPPVWRVLPVSEIRPVQPGPTRRARGLLRRLWDGVAGGDAPAPDATPDEERLRPLQAERLDALLPEPPLAAQRAALRRLTAEQPRAVLLRPEDGSWDAALQERAAAAPAGPRPPEEPPVRDGLPRSLDARLRDPAPLHVPRLERWYVRHHDGLGALRGLLAALGAREDPWSLDVSAWAWAWMHRVLPEVRALPAPYATAPLDGEAMQGWIGAPGEVRVRGDGEPPDTAVFESLAARARGEPGVAAAIWRACLRDGAEAAEEDDAEEDDAEVGTRPRRGGTVWLRHPSDVELPDTVGLDRDDLIVLYTVLTHGGATPATLRRALPYGEGVAGSAAAEMAGRGLLGRDEGGRYVVRPIAVPAVRARLRAESFPVEYA